MPVSPAELLRMLREQHATALSIMQHRCLGLLAVGFGDVDGARLLGIAQSSFRRHIGEAEARVLDPLGLPHLRAALVTWFWLHQECCTRPVLKMIERNELGGPSAN